MQTKDALVARQIERPLALKARNCSLLAGLVAGALALFGCSGGTGRSVAAASLVSGTTQSTSDPGPAPTQVSPTEPQPATTPGSTVTSVAISPSPVSALPGGHLQFTANVQGSAADKSVTWTAALGGISASGFYTAPMSPSTDTVTAISNADQTESGSANVMVTSASPTPSGPLPAFPGAQGGGAASVGGRGGQVFEVTNLNDSGSGSLRACAEGSGPRTCIFRVGGTIQMQSPIRIQNPFLTIAGQTAPGDGILLSGHLDPTQGLMIQTHDVIVRYVRVRMGANSSRPPGSQEGSPLWIGNGDVYNVIVDHGSFSWTTDENVTIYVNQAGVYNRSITIQYSAIGEGLAGHSTDIITGSNFGNFDKETDIDFSHNFLFDSSHRRPLLKNTSTHFVNNIVYNSAFYSTQALGGIMLDAIGNLYKNGTIVSGVHEIQLSDVDSGDGPKGTPSVYLSGNMGWNLPSSGGDQWLLAAHITGENTSEVGAVPTSYRRATPMPAQVFPITADDVNKLEISLLPVVGASQRLDCIGNWVLDRDSVDARWFTNYFAGNGTLPASENDVGGFPTLNPGTPCQESLHDGIPDQWKIARGLSTFDNALANSAAPNGYTYLENYLNGTDPNLPVQ